MNRTVHIIGAGLAGLATAVRLCAQGAHAIVYEATNQAGGRCRSYHDPVLGITIDNGNHLLLSGNRAALGYLDTIGASDRLFGPSTASFPFIDLASKERWTLRANDGRIPWWIFDRNRRVPGTRVRDYLSTLRLLRAPPGAAIRDVIDCKGPLYDRLIGPLLLAALNTEPPPSSAKLAAAVVRETLAAGGRSYRPLFARDGLSAAFVEPAAIELMSEPDQVSRTAVTALAPAGPVQAEGHQRQARRQAAAAQLPRHERWKRRLHPATW